MGVGVQGEPGGEVAEDAGDCFDVHAVLYCDSVRALALCCEIGGDIAGAIAARELELAISEKDWHDTTGESVEVIRRELDRLHKLTK